MEVGPRHWRVACEDESTLSPELLAGVLEAGLEPTKVHPTITSSARDRSHFDLEITWD